MTNEEVLGDYKSFITDLLGRATNLKIDLENFPIDHLCYRTATSADYEQIKQKMMTISSAYAENLHHNRPIAKFLLKTPLIFENFTIPLVELSAPKEGAPYPSGLEHLEMAVGGAFDRFVEKYQELWTGRDDSGPFNQPAYITFDNGKTIKFHKDSLLEVLKAEGQSFKPIDTVSGAGIKFRQSQEETYAVESLRARILAPQVLFSLRELACRHKDLGQGTAGDKPLLLRVMLSEFSPALAEAGRGAGGNHSTNQGQGGLSPLFLFRFITYNFWNAGTS